MIWKHNCYFIEEKKKLIRTKVKVYFINLEIIGKEKKYFLNLKKNWNMVKPLDVTIVSKPNFYYILDDDMIWYIYIYIYRITCKLSQS